VISLLLAAALAQQPFAMPWQQNDGALSDVSSLVEAPAGKSGFITVRNGHLARPDGKRFRIWGVNITGAANLPSQKDAPAVAAHLARFGINCVRMHFLDRVAPMGILDATRPDTRALDPQQMDRLDFFIAQLKQHGIYVDLNLNVARGYKPADGVKDIELLGFAKALTYFDERLLFLQREYASQLLTHVNPYTKSEYRNEPAVLLVEFVNENSIVESWASGRLLGRNTRKNPGTWSDIPASYEKDLTALYHAWLAKQNLPPEPRLTRSEIATAPADRYRRELSFYMELEDHFFQSMQTYLKKDLGVKSLLLGTSDHNHGLSGYPLLHSTSRLDVVDGHVYWQHPHYLEDPATGRHIGFDIPNTAMVNDPTHSTVVELSRSAFAGKPYVVSEVNHPFPAEHAAEGIPILTAYAALQDWDGLFWYTFEHIPPDRWPNEALGHFEIRHDPVKMAEIAAGALMFLRGDVKPASQTVTRAYTTNQTLDSLRLPNSERPYFTPGFPLALPLVHATRIETLDAAKPTAAYDLKPSDPIVSDTGELTWQKGTVSIDTPRTQAWIGAPTAKSLTNLKVDLQNDFAAVLLTSMDASPLATSKRMLLITGGKTSNTGMEWNEKRTSLTNWGKAPILIEPVKGTITLRGLKHTAKLELTPLDGAGRPKGQPIQAKRCEDGWQLELSAPTPWYQIVTR
jgi:hypothetical protein